MTARFLKRRQGKTDTEPFKVSKKSICHQCKNYKNKCSPCVNMTCGTDSKEGLAYVERCQEYEKDKT